MASLSEQRCLNHATREAVVRCPGCKQYFCRECVTEHDARMMCAACLRKLVQVPLLKRRGFISVLRFCHCVLGLVLAWFLFYLLGEGLLAIPSSFHDGTIWQSFSK